jgi:transketolase
MKTQRDSFWERIYDLARADRNLVVVSADMGAPALDRFRRDLPSQYVDVGIAEQQAIGAAAGLTLGGKKAFAYAIAPFITLRCYEHIRVSLAMMNIPVTLVGVGSGFSYDDSGPTHHTVEDLSVLRILPHMRIENVTDIVMAAAMADLSCGLKVPNYVRLDRKPLPTLYTPGHDFTPGAHAFLPATDSCILATGNMVHVALDVAERLKTEGIQIGVIDCYRLPLPGDVLLPALKGVQTVFTLEEHTLPGGFGSAVCELLADNGMPVRVKRFGLDFRQGYCYQYGGREHLMSLYGLDAASLTKCIAALLCKPGRLVAPA